MTQDQVVSEVVRALEVAMLVSLPLMGVALLVGLLIGVFQAVTQIQEMTLTFVPKILAMVLVVVVAGPWMLDTFMAWTSALWISIPEVAGP